MFGKAIYAGVMYGLLTFVTDFVTDFFNRLLLYKSQLEKPQ